MFEQIAFIDKCDCCDNHILYMDISQMRGNHYESGKPVEKGYYPIADLTPRELCLLMNECSEALTTLSSKEVQTNG